MPARKHRPSSSTEDKVAVVGVACMLVGIVVWYLLWFALLAGAAYGLWTVVA